MQRALLWLLIAACSAESEPADAPPEAKIGKKDAKTEKAKGDKVRMQKQEIDRQVVDGAGVYAPEGGGVGGLIGQKGTQIGTGGMGYGERYADYGTNAVELAEDDSL